MGVIADFFRRDSPPRTPRRRPLSTLDVPLPPPQPLSRSTWTGTSQGQSTGIRSRFGPRDPYNVFDHAAKQENVGAPLSGPGDSLEGDFAALRVSGLPPGQAHHVATAPPLAQRPSLSNVRTSASAPAFYPSPTPGNSHPPPPTPPRPRFAETSISSAPLAYESIYCAPQPLPLRPSSAPGHALGPPPRPPRPPTAPAPPFAGPSTQLVDAALLRSGRTPAPTRKSAVPSFPRRVSAPTSTSSGSGSAFIDLSSSYSSDDTLPPPSQLGRSRSPRTPGTARRAAAPASAPPRTSGTRASLPEPASTPRKTPTPRKKASPPRSGEAQQCAALTARMTRCTRVVHAPAFALGESGGGDEEPALEVEERAPAYCGQHARGKLVESGCFLRARAGLGSASSGTAAERWVRYADWIPEDLPDETKALLRHYMALAVSDRDCEGFLYVHELVPKGSSPALHPNGPALIKLGRSIRPLERLSQWRASCPSREPIVRLFAPSLPVSGTEEPRGTRNHHRWERLCLVELAGRAAVAAGKRSAQEPCGDCGRTHVECFVLPRASVSERGAGAARAGWTVRETVERWGRWCEGLG